MTYQERRQKWSGKVAQRIHARLGVKFDYTAITDRTTNPVGKTVFNGIHLRVTPTTWVHEEQGMRRVRKTEDMFEISRENLKITGGFHAPIKGDSFVETGTTTPVFRVKTVDEDQELAGKYTLLVEAHDGFTVRGRRND